MTDSRQDEAKLITCIADIVSQDLSLHQYLDAVTAALVAQLPAQSGFYFPYWREGINLVSAQCEFGDKKWQTSDEESEVLSDHAEAKFHRCPDKLVFSDVEPVPFVCLRLVVHEHPHMWVVLALESPLTDACAHLLEKVQPWLQTGLLQCHRKQALSAAQSRMDEVTRGMAETMAQLVQAEKMSELGKLTAGIAHEINNPIGYIRSNLETLVEYIDTFDEAFHCLKNRAAKEDTSASQLFVEIERQFDIPFLLEDGKDIVSTNVVGIDRISGIVSDLYAFSRKGKGEMRPVSLQEVIKRSVSLTKSRFDENHVIEIHCSVEDPICLADAAQIEQVVVNLMINAAYAMPGGGTLTMLLTEKGDRLVLRVTDTGIGMDSETLKKVFTPFFTTKPTGEGTGLGLSISHGILQNHNATIQVESKVNHGTSFVLSFPRHRQK